MRASFVYFSLLVQLLCVLPALGEKYHIHNRQLKDYIVSTGEEMHGDLVKTVPCKGNNDPPPHTVHYASPSRLLSLTRGIECRLWMSARPSAKKQKA